MSFAEVLQQKVEAPALRKAERTRLRLLAATARLLAEGREQGELRVNDIAAEASLAHGTFYLYFADRKAAVEALVTDFVHFQRVCLAAIEDGAPGSETRVRATTLAYVRLFKANAGLMRCLMDLGNDMAIFRERFQNLNREWNGRVAAAIARWRAEIPGGDALPSEALLPRAYALDGMVDEFLTQLYVRWDPALQAMGEDEEAVADLLSELWCLGAYGRLP